jgi:hypothetical protein
MMGTMNSAEASVSQAAHRQDMYSRSQSAESQPLRAAASRTPMSLVERVRTFVDRTLDAAFGRFDH